MARTFNCGVGMVAAVAADKADATMKILREQGETVWRIGHVRARQGDEAQSQVLGTDQAWRG
jgi:phosphoribosylformylglycinamidine cyclo-ligase